jgi:hypothetical protein
MRIELNGFPVDVDMSGVERWSADMLQTLVKLHLTGKAVMASQYERALEGKFDLNAILQQAGVKRSRVTILYDQEAGVDNFEQFQKDREFIPT